ncbi:MAG: hypothetical protein PHE73_00930 [Sulfurovaceae bacterium]|nr:hypothetical protein [Sulfurovaceae bacterium]
MKNYIFITNEGFTFQPNSQSDIPDIENMQVIGFATGKDAVEAFEQLKIDNPYLFDTAFDEIMALELSSKDKTYHCLKS